VILAYYNGANIGLLGDDSLPRKDVPPHPDLQDCMSAIELRRELNLLAKAELRPWQITVQPKNPVTRRRVRAILHSILSGRDNEKLRVFESGHSFDILAPGVSKRALIAYLERQGMTGKGQHILKIGDRGAWPGNDCELLSTPFSLSVDAVSDSPDTCWNIGRPGQRGVHLALEYLRSLSVSGGVARYGAPRGRSL
jgi:hypothetical protein